MRRVYIYDVEYICICMLCMYDDDKYIINYWGSTSMIHICMYMDIFFRTVEGGRGGEAGDR